MVGASARYSCLHTPVETVTPPRRQRKLAPFRFPGFRKCRESSISAISLFLSKSNPLRWASIWGDTGDWKRRKIKLKKFEKAVDKKTPFWYDNTCRWEEHLERGEIWGYSSAGRALEWHSRGQRFDPAYLHQKPSKSSDFGGFSLSWESFRQTNNSGSIPLISTKKSWNMPN